MRSAPLKSAMTSPKEPISETAENTNNPNMVGKHRTAGLPLSWNVGHVMEDCGNSVAASVRPN